MRILFIGFLTIMTTVLFQIACVSLNGEGPVSINEKLVQEGCTSCHEFPSDSGEHDYHVNQEGKECFECHFFTVERDTFLFISTVGDTSDTSYRFTQQKMQITDDNDTIPITISEIHINNRLDVAIKQRVQDSVNDTLVEDNIVWDNSEKTCSNMKACHSEADPAHFQLELWYGPKNGKK